MMAAARVLVGVIAQSVAQVEDEVTLPQLRVLVLAATRGPLSSSAVAQALGVHASNASRTVDRLVAAGLLARRESAGDRRYVELTLTPQGRRVVRTVMTSRRRAVERVLTSMPVTRRRALAPVLRAFAAAAGELGELGDDSVWAEVTVA